MLAFLTRIVLALRSMLDGRASREAEILVLRQQPMVLNRKFRKRVRLRALTNATFSYALEIADHACSKPAHAARALDAGPPGYGISWHIAINSPPQKLAGCNIAPGLSRRAASPVASEARNRVQLFRRFSSYRRTDAQLAVASAIHNLDASSVDSSGGRRHRKCQSA